MLCINCEKADLKPAVVQLSGTVREKKYAVEMEGLKCPNCGYATLHGKSMPEFGRLLADKYRAENGLLTSDQIRGIRHRLGMNQQQFADYIDAGVASVKRWELGKIQDKDSNARILAALKPNPRQTYVCKFLGPALETTYTQPFHLTAGTYYACPVQREDLAKNNAGKVKEYVLNMDVVDTVDEITMLAKAPTSTVVPAFIADRLLTGE